VCYPLVGKGGKKKKKREEGKRRKKERERERAFPTLATTYVCAYQGREKREEQKSKRERHVRAIPVRGKSQAA